MGSTSAESFYPIRSVVCVGWLIIGQATRIPVRNSFPTTACPLIELLVRTIAVTVVPASNNRGKPVHRFASGYGLAGVKSTGAYWPMRSSNHIGVLNRVRQLECFTKASFQLTRSHAGKIEIPGQRIESPPGTINEISKGAL